MRALSIAGAAAAVLTTTLLVAGPASADRVCRQVCDGGICKSRCVDRGPRLYNMRDPESTSVSGRVLSITGRALTLR
jgi:hypothetical protein